MIYVKDVKKYKNKKTEKEQKFKVIIQQEKTAKQKKKEKGACTQ